MACLIGVPDPVHMREVERPDGLQNTARRQDLAD